MKHEKIKVRKYLYAYRNAFGVWKTTRAFYPTIERAEADNKPYQVMSIENSLFIDVEDEGGPNDLPDTNKDREMKNCGFCKYFDQDPQHPHQGWCQHRFCLLPGVAAFPDGLAPSVGAESHGQDCDLFVTKNP